MKALFPSALALSLFSSVSLGGTPPAMTAQYWREIGAGSATLNGVSNETLGAAGAPSVAIDPMSGQMYAAWEGGNSDIFVRRWTGSEWALVGGALISNNAGQSRFPVLAIGADSRPVVAWVDKTSGNWEVYVRRFNLTTALWENVGDGSAAGAGISKALGSIGSAESAQVSVAVGSNNTIFVSWCKAGADAAKTSRVVVNGYTGTAWKMLGDSADLLAGEYGSEPLTTPAPQYLGASQPALLIGADGLPLVAYITRSDTSPGDVHVCKWNGSAWLAAGTGSATNAGISSSSPRDATGFTLSSLRLALAPDGKAHAGWIYAGAGGAKSIQVRRLIESTWTDAGPLIERSDLALNAGLALMVGNDNAPVVAYPIVAPAAPGTAGSATFANTEIYLQTLVRSTSALESWQELGAGSASGGGLSASNGSSLFPVLAVSKNPAASLPVVAWLDGSDSAAPIFPQVYARRFQAAATQISFSKSIFSTPESGGSALISVTRTGALGEASTVNYASADGTATAGSDYTAVSGQLIFAANESTRTFSVPILADTVVEPTESVQLTLSAPAGAELLVPQTAVLNIVDAVQGAGVLQFSAVNYSIGENGGRALVRVERTGGSDGAVSVHYETVAASNATSIAAATANLDYTPVSGTLQFAPGETFKIIEVPILEDTLVEPAENFWVSLGTLSGGATLGTPNKASVTILDNDSAPPSKAVVAFAVAESHVLENAGSIVLTVTRTGDLSQAGSVDFATPTASTAAVAGSVGMATPGADYSPTAGTLSFAAGESLKTLSIPILNDTLLEGSEAFPVTLQNAQGATLGAPATIKVVIDEPVAARPGTLALSATAYPVGEGAGRALITVVRKDGSAGEVSVQYATTPGVETLVAGPLPPGIAIAGADYTAVSGTLVLGDGVVSKSFEIPILEDTLVEGPETFAVVLNTPTGGATLSPAANRATVSITDNDTPSDRSFGFDPVEYHVLEADTTVEIRVNRTGDLSQPAAVDYFTTSNPGSAIASGVATAGADYLEATGTLSFAAGEAVKTFRVNILADTVTEGSETFQVALRNPSGATLGVRAAGKVVIEEGTPAPGTVQFASAQFAGAEGKENAIITVFRKDGGAGAISVKYTTLDLSGVEHAATAGADYTAVSGTLTFAPGQTSATFAVPILEDTLVEGAEVLGLALSEVSGGATLGSLSTARLVVADNDLPPGRLQFAAEAYRVKESAGQAQIAVTRKEGSAGPVSVHYATADGTANAGSDYTATTGILNFAAGQSTASFAVPILADAIVEGAETFLITLSEAGGGAVLGAPLTTTVTIDDATTAGTLSFSKAEYKTTEHSGQALITVSRSEGSAGAVSVDFVTADDTATAGTDYTPASGTLSFATGEKSKTFSVPILTDTLIEGPEAVSLILSNPAGGAKLGARSMARLLIADDNLAVGTLQFSAAAYKVSENGKYATLTVVRRDGNAGPVTVKYSTADGSATAGSDYTAVSGTLEFGAGQMSKTFRVPVLMDTIVEGTETVNLTLSEPGGGALLGQQATATLSIIDAAASAGSIQFAAAEYGVNESAGSATVTVTRTAGLDGAVSVHYAASEGTARDGSDFTAVSGTLSFAAGEKSKTFTIPILNDMEVEETETVRLNLSDPSGGALLGTPAAATLYIIDGSVVKPPAR